MELPTVTEAPGPRQRRAPARLAQGRRSGAQGPAPRGGGPGGASGGVGLGSWGRPWGWGWAGGGAVGCESMGHVGL